MADLGSAAVGTANALGSVGGHSIHKKKEERRRAASARPARKGRSRSPGDEPPKGRATVVDRVVRAPIYIEPGKEPEGVKSNAERVFDYLAHIERVINDHADIIEAADAEEDVVRDRMDLQALDMANMKSVIAKADADSKAILEYNDGKLKEDMAASFQKVWDFLSQNNTGIAQMFSEADAAVAKLGAALEEELAAGPRTPDLVIAELLEPAQQQS